MKTDEGIGRMDARSRSDPDRGVLALAGAHGSRKVPLRLTRSRREEGKGPRSGVPEKDVSRKEKADTGARVRPGGRTVDSRLWTTAHRRTTEPEPNVMAYNPVKTPS